MRKTYTARCRRAGDWWAISVPELRGVHTQARRLEKVEAMVRDAIALFLDVPQDSFDITIEPVLPRDLQKKVGRAHHPRFRIQNRSNPPIEGWPLRTSGHRPDSSFDSSCAARERT